MSTRASRGILRTDRGNESRQALEELEEKGSESVVDADEAADREGAFTFPWDMFMTLAELWCSE